MLSPIDNRFFPKRINSWKGSNKIANDGFVGTYPGNVSWNKYKLQQKLLIDYGWKMARFRSNIEQGFIR